MIVIKRREYCEMYESPNDKMAGARKENGSGSNAQKDYGRKIF
jgi:hypothetical protein